MSDRSPRYSLPIILIHWATLALLVASFVSHEDVDDAIEAFWRSASGALEFGAAVHVSAGMLVLVLTLVRLVLRAAQGAPAPVPGTHPLAHRAAGAAHAALYLLLLALPLSGIAVALELGKDLDDLHEGLFNVLLALVALHAGAALVHHFVLRDGLLDRMRPGRAG